MSRHARKAQVRGLERECSLPFGDRRVRQASEKVLVGVGEMIPDE